MANDKHNESCPVRFAKGTHKFFLVCMVHGPAAVVIITAQIDDPSDNVSFSTTGFTHFARIHVGPLSVITQA